MKNQKRNENENHKIIQKQKIQLRKRKTFIQVFLLLLHSNQT